MLIRVLGWTINNLMTQYSVGLGVAMTATPSPKKDFNVPSIGVVS